ncbi:oxygenase MpaB family protein [Nocardia terpenica]|uniref:DUF2236 domain-containing protein n=1 Tax=Nocardia terpenica TaxID=455432 RepID=A0A6G9Z3T3_9NOCA|nr:oxygenase MpaB family protein [Nocardia terpenica]QIS20100.1 DUF2236 domain-containing protein [Nocardia terpenica]
MDPARDYEEINRRLLTVEFTTELVLGSEFAQIATFAVPIIGELLARTGEFVSDGVRRNDDTGLLLGEVTVHGFGSARGKRAIGRINRVHAPYDISGDDFRYVLATFVVYGARTVATHGRRPLTTIERDGLFHHYRQLGRHMAIKDIPESYGEMAAFLDAYEAERFGFTMGAHRVAMANRDRMAAQYFPKLPRSAALDLTDALIPEHLRRTLRLPHPSPAARLLVTAGLKVRRAAGRYLPRNDKPVDLLAESAERSYPGGYTIDQLGPRCPVEH